MRAAHKIAGIMICFIGTYYHMRYIFNSNLFLY